ncbi:hypothetical protein ULMS_21090 [Patiriisocius marinistellae]|uniref:histidine kinase n=1 Tax=Patiriisocius marinistellae TaxID=2494560 RepID=A0A5J4G2X6_9FLAO|nr:ATP-binding protein [Patiriisocius marinistellae]GEQ86601.1 hypothetical protein ULMS_21090 [Patiriisocius marinistellae]
MLYSGLISGEKEVFSVTLIGIALLLAVVIIVLLLVFMGSKNSLVKEQEQAKKSFEKELAESQIEIREATLRNISWELHDNIGQLLTLAKIQAQSIKDHPERIDEMVQTIGTGLDELRALSKLINPDVLKSLSLSEAVQLEIDRFNRLEFINASLEISGSPFSFNANHEIILFRILQEFFSNTIKHSKASNLEVVISFSEIVTMEAKDNGIGFAEMSKIEGIGLLNMKNRAKLIGAQLQLISEEKKGTQLKIQYKPTNQKII